MTLLSLIKNNLFSGLNSTMLIHRYLLCLFLAVLLKNTLAQSPQTQSPQTQSAQTLDAIVAVVNGEPITSSEVDRRVKFQLLELKRQNINPPDPSSLRGQLLENAIIESLLLQQVKQDGLLPDDETVQLAAQANMARAGLTMQQMQEQLAKNGATLAEYFNDLKNEIGMSRLREREVGERIKVSDAEIDRFLRSPNTGAKQEYSVYQLILPKKEGMTAQELAALNDKAQSLRARIVKGESFEALAKQFSVASDAAQGGKMGFKSLDKLPEMYALIVENLGRGDVSEVLESSAGLHILQLDAVRLETPSIQQTRARHILIRVDGFTGEAAALDEIKRLHSMLILNKDRFSELAKQFSQDGSAQSGGDLGWAIPGDMVPEFDAVMDKTQLNEVSSPVRTQFGWHVLQVLERQTRPLTRERLRSQARALLRQRKQETTLNEWLQELRAKAFIEYKKSL
jgi:peptidyl-prolyl cis-trans isomerase SurA